MFKFPVLVWVIAITSSVVTTNWLDTTAIAARPALDLNRGLLCTALLSRDWEDDRFDDPSPIPSRSGLPLARAFVGDSSQIDDETAQFLNEAQVHTLMRTEITGDEDIRQARAEADRIHSKNFDRGQRVPSIAHWQVFKDYEVTRYASELADFDRILDDYAAGKNTQKSILAIVRQEVPASFSFFAIASLTSSWVGTPGKHRYYWHILSYDPDLEIPVWRAGISEM